MNVCFYKGIYLNPAESEVTHFCVTIERKAVLTQNATLPRTASADKFGAFLEFCRTCPTGNNSNALLVCKSKISSATQLEISGFSHYIKCVYLLSFLRMEKENVK